MKDSSSMIIGRLGMMFAAAACLAGCASTPASAPETWGGGEATHLAADQAACHTEANNLDVNQPSNYSDPRYGEASAMAEAVARDNPMANRAAIVRQAAFDICMNDKGWRSPQ